MIPFYDMMTKISSTQGDRVTITTAILIGLLTGTIGTSAVTTWIHTKNNKQSEIIENQNATLLQLSSLQAQLQLGDQEIKKQLTSTDLLAVSCSESWMEKNTDKWKQKKGCKMKWMV